MKKILLVTIQCDAKPNCSQSNGALTTMKALLGPSKGAMPEAPGLRPISIWSKSMKAEPEDKRNVNPHSDMVVEYSAKSSQGGTSFEDEES